MFAFFLILWWSEAQRSDSRCVSLYQNYLQHWSDVAKLHCWNMLMALLSVLNHIKGFEDLSVHAAFGKHKALLQLMAGLRAAGLVKSRPLDRWRETLALLSAYSDTDEFCALCDLLAKRLAGAGLPQVRSTALSGA